MKTNYKNSITADRDASRTYVTYVLINVVLGFKKFHYKLIEVN